MAGGLGTRMRSQVPKHLHPLLGKRLVDWVIAPRARSTPTALVVVTSPGSADAYDGGVEVAVQERPLGTGDAVAAAREALDGFEGGVLIIPGDAPLVTAELLRGARRGAPARPARTSRSSPSHRRCRSRTAASSGTKAGTSHAIVEEKDASEEERAIEELNASYYVFDAVALWRALEQLDADNAQGELYLTDAVEHLVAAGGRASAHRSEADPHQPDRSEHARRSRPGRRCASRPR